MMVELWKRKREMGDEGESDIEDTGGYGKSGVRLAWLGVTPLVLLLSFRDLIKSLNDPSIDTWSEIMNYYSNFYIGSTFWICSPIGHISIAERLYQLIYNNSQTKSKSDVLHLWIRIGRNFSILNGYSSLAGKLIHGRQPKNYSLMLQWFLFKEMRCHQSQTTKASRNMHSHVRDKLWTINQYIGVLSTEWTCTNQPFIRHSSLRLGE